MWRPAHRIAADRRGLHYPSDLTDGEWALIGPMIPTVKRGGRKRTADVREDLSDILCAPL
jgi:transposase